MSEARTRGPDILVRTAPPLSAVSDEPLAAIPEPPVSASNSAADQANGTPAEMSADDQAAATVARQNGEVAEPPAADTPTEQQADGETPPEEVEPSKEELDKTPPWMKRQLTRAKNAQKQADEKAARLAAELTEARKQAEELQARIPPPPKPEEIAPEPRPRRDQFNDPDAYDTALETWSRQEGERQANARMEADRRAAEAQAATDAENKRLADAQAEMTRLNTEFEKKKAVLIEKHADYEEVAGNNDLPISMPMAHAILRAPNGPEMNYHLGKHAEEAKRIAEIDNPGQQIFEMGRLSAKLEQPARVQVPRAPAPIEPLRGNASAADTSEREPSMAEWGARRTAELQAARRPFVQQPPPQRH